MKYTLYQIDCVDGTIYIGVSRNFIHRMRQHFTGYGAVATRKHPPRTYTRLAIVGTAAFAKELEGKLVRRLKQTREVLVFGGGYTATI